MTKIKRCYKGSDLDNIDMKGGCTSYHQGVRNISKLMPNQDDDDLPDNIYTSFEDEEEDYINEKIDIGCDSCKDDPDYLYCGEDLYNLGVKKGDKFSDIFELIDQAMSECFNKQWDPATVIVKWEDGSEIDILTLESGDIKEVVIPNCPPTQIIVTNSTGEQQLNISVPSGETYTYEAEDSNYVVEYEDGTLIEEGLIPSGGSKSIIVSKNWKRPADWLPIDDLVSIGDHKFAGLFAVFPDRPNIIAVSSSQAFTVDWGDGNVINYSSGAIAEYSYNFNDIISTQTVIDGVVVRQVIIQVYPQVAPWTGTFNFVANRVVNRPTQYVANWLDIRISSTTLNIMTTTLLYRNLHLRKYTHLGSTVAQSIQNLLRGTKISEFNCDLSNYTNLGNFFYETYDMVSIGDLNISSTTAAVSAFARTRFRVMGNITATSATSLATLLSTNLDLENVGVITTSASLVNINQLASQCPKLKALEITNCVNVNDSTGVVTSCFSLERLILNGLRIGVTIPPCRMNEQAFIDFFTALGTANGSQSIVITGNITLSSSTIAIATSKGFSIIP